MANMAVVRIITAVFREEMDTLFSGGCVLSEHSSFSVLLL